MNEVKLIQDDKVIGEYKVLRYSLTPIEEEPENFHVIGHIWGRPPEGRFKVMARDYGNHNKRGLVTLEDCLVTQEHCAGGNELQFSGKYQTYKWDRDKELSGPPLINRALEIAQRAHQTQLDKSGESYILHPLRVMQSLWLPDFGVNQGQRYEAMAAALLHDVLEDTNFTAKELMEHGIPEKVVEAVQYLTHYPHMSYEYYIKKICTNPIALQVKKADLADNLRPDRLCLIKEETRARLVKKYQQALKQIEVHEAKINLAGE